MVDSSRGSLTLSDSSAVITLDLSGQGDWTERVADPSDWLLRTVASLFGSGATNVTVSAKISDHSATTIDPLRLAAGEMVRGVAGSAALEFAETGCRVNTVLWTGESDPSDVQSTLDYLGNDVDAGFTTGATIHLLDKAVAPESTTRDGVVLVTGGAGGLGRAAADRLVAMGRSVVISDLPGDQLDHAASELGVPAIGANLSDVESLEALVQSPHLEGLDTLLIHHGVGASSRLDSHYDAAAGLRSIAINGTSVWRTFEMLRPRLAQQPSSTAVMLSSVAGLTAEPGNGAYGAAKFAVVGYVRGNYHALTEDGIRLHALCPGPIDTPLMRSIFAGFARDVGLSAEEFTANRLGSIPLKMAGSPHHIGAAAAYLSQLAAPGIVLAPTGGEVLT